MKYIFNNVVSFDMNNLSNFKDVEYYSLDIMENRLLHYPSYIKEADNKPEDAYVSKVNFHQ
jgi:hypothetical protein